MATTVVSGGTYTGTASPLAILQALPELLDYYMTREGIFSPVMGTAKDACIRVLTELDRVNGDTLRAFIARKLANAPTSGDNQMETNEEALNIDDDTVNILQARNAVLLGGKMTEQRSIIDLIALMGDSLVQWVQDWVTELLTFTMSGARGVRAATIIALGFTGWGTNGLQAPDAAHIIYGYQATSAATLTGGETMSVRILRRVKKAIGLLMNGTARPMRPTLRGANGKLYFPLYMTEEQAADLWQDPAFIDAQTRAKDRGDNNPMFTGEFATWDNFMLFTNPVGVLFNTYGSSGALPAARAVVLGSNAVMYGYASIPGGGGFVDMLQQTGVQSEANGNVQGREFVGSRQPKPTNTNTMPSVQVTRKAFDYANQEGCAVAIMIGAKKTRVNSTDHAVFSVDTAYSA